MWHPAEAQVGILWIKELFPMATASQIAVVHLTPDLAGLKLQVTMLSEVVKSREVAEDWEG